MERVTKDFSLRIGIGMLHTFPELVARPGFAERVMLGLATMRGLAMPGFAEVAEPDALWKIARPRLLEAFEILLADETS
jgi:transketolase C-terminal domain/subunit